MADEVVKYSKGKSRAWWINELEIVRGEFFNDLSEEFAEIGLLID